MNEKQKTCITIKRSADPLTTFTENIFIPHQVDVIRVSTIGGIFIAAGPSVPLDIFYVTSNLISNTHDNILGVISAYNSQSTKFKQFSSNIPMINGTYTFNVFSDGSGLLNTNRAGIFIDIEFIELEK